jgi:uncharacterized UPF0160 family protein
VASLQIYLEKNNVPYEVFRTERDSLPVIDNQNDFVVDVGFVYDKDKNLFDHHQNSFDKRHIHNILYASFGIVWDKFGKDICGDETIASEIEKKMVVAIDAGDNGVVTASKIYDDVPVLTWDIFVRTFYPEIGDEREEKYLEGFLKAVSYAKELLLGSIKREKGLLEKKLELENDLKNENNFKVINNKKILFLDKVFNWKLSLSLIPYPNDIDFIVSNRPDGQIQAVAVRKSSNTLESKILPPENWRGKRQDELVQASGVPDLHFCHKGGFLFTGNTKESIIKALGLF